MFRRLAAVAACAAFFLLGAVPTGALYVTTLPSGADVWIDGTYIGHSPLVLDALTAGKHSVSLTKTGWRAQDLEVTVVAGTTALSSVQMARAASRGMRMANGFIAIKGAPSKEVTVDGEALKADTTGAFAVSPGMHVVVVRVAKGKVSRNVTVYPEMRTDVVVRDGENPRSAVVAPASDYLPADAVKLDGTRVVVRHGGHAVVAKVGSTTYVIDGQRAEYDSAPTLIGGKLYLPLELLGQLTANDKGR
ncbi:MAG: PEGA domain-containing protein [Candidatus Velthaea sp.]